MQVAAERIAPSDRPAAEAASPSASPAHSAPSAEHLQQIQAARLLAKPLKRAAAIASFSGWTLAIFALLTMATSFSSFWGMMLGIGMAAVAWFEFRGGKALGRLEPVAPKHLAINQLAFGAILFLYSAHGAYTCFTGPGIYSDMAGSADPQVQMMLAPVDHLAQAISGAVYVAMMAIAILVPGCTAVYYASRRNYLATYLSKSPAWIVELNRKGMTV